MGRKGEGSSRGGTERDWEVGRGRRGRDGEFVGTWSAEKGVLFAIADAFSVCDCEGDS